MQIFFNLHSTEYRTKTKYLMFKLINLMLFCKYTFMVNLMPAMPALWDNKHQQNDRFQLTVPKWSGIQHIPWQSLKSTNETD